jgi:hypothetical protein
MLQKTSGPKCPRRNESLNPMISVKNTKIQMSTLNNILNEKYGMHIQKNPTR